jgi:hypothetical protein
MTIVCDLAVQHLVVSPDPQPATAAAVTYDVGRQFMRGDDKVVGPTARQACLVGMRGNRCPKLIQRIRIQWLIKDDLGAAT